MNTIKLFIFQGGGYDGCIWEWNALVIQNGKLREDVKLVSGSGNWLFNDCKTRGIFRTIREHIRERQKEPYYFLIDSPKDWLEFQREFNKGFARTVARTVQKNLRDDSELHDQFNILCDKCGNTFPSNEIYHTGYRGDGGIGLQFDDNHCYDCACELHEDYLAEEWKRASIKERVAMLKGYTDKPLTNHQTGKPVSIFAARRDTFPHIDAREVYELELF